MAMPLASAGKTGMSASQSGGNSPRQAALQLARQIGKGLRVRRHAIVPSRFGARATRPAPRENAPAPRSGIRNARLGRPAEVLLGQADFLDAERRAVRLEAVVLVRRAVADVRAHQNQRRPRRFRARGLQRGVDRGEIVAVRDTDTVCQP